MLMEFEKTSKLINDGKLLHIAGTEELLKKLPKGNWIGGSTEYFMTSEGGKVSGDLLFVQELPYKNFVFKSYSVSDLENVTVDSFDSGFSIVIMPYDSEVHNEYARKSAGYEGMFLKNITGWVSGVNLSKTGQVPIAVNGVMGEAYTDKAVALHLETPADKTVNISIINIFEQDASNPVVEFVEEGFTVTNCIVDGKKIKFADYLAQNNIDVKIPLVGNYSGVGVNIAIKAIDGDAVSFYGAVFNGIQYRFAKNVPDYVGAFQKQLVENANKETAFACNCVLNFLYGEFEGKDLKTFAGPVTFGEIAYQLVNQTLVYVTLEGSTTL